MKRDLSRSTAARGPKRSALLLLGASLMACSANGEPSLNDASAIDASESGPAIGAIGDGGEDTGEAEPVNPPYNTDGGLADSFTSPDGGSESRNPWPADFDPIATCMGQANGVRFRTIGSAPRSSGGASAVGCVSVGASDSSRPEVFADVRAFGFAAAPIVYVNASAEAGGDGSSSSPYRTLEEALRRAVPARTIMLAGGIYTVPRGEGGAPYAITRELAIVGASPVGGLPTTLSTAMSTGTFAVTGPAAALSLSNVRLEAASSSIDAHVNVSGGASAFVSNAVIVGGADGVLARGVGTRVELDRVTLMGAMRTSVHSTSGATVLVRRTVARGGARAVLLAEGGALSARETAVLPIDTTPLAGEGVVYLDAPPTEGAVDRLDRVVVRLARSVGIRVAGPGRRVSAALVEVSGTQRESGDAVGVFVDSQAELSIDDGLTRNDTNNATDTTVGSGSLIGGNFGIGVLASGAGATLRLNGALVEHNEGPGIVVQNDAVAPMLQLVDANANMGAGFAITTGASLVGIFDDTARSTRRNSRAGVPLFDLGAGFVLSRPTSLGGSGRVQIFDDTARDNARLGVLVLRANVSVRSLSGSPLFRSSDSMVDVQDGSAVAIFDDTARTDLLGPSIEEFGAIALPLAFPRM